MRIYTGEGAQEEGLRGTQAREGDGLCTQSFTEAQVARTPAFSSPNGGPQAGENLAQGGRTGKQRHERNSGKSSDLQ